MKHLDSDDIFEIIYIIKNKTIVKISKFFKDEHKFKNYYEFLDGLFENALNLSEDIKRSEELIKLLEQERLED